MRLLLQFFQAMNRAAERAENKEHPDPQSAVDMLDIAIGEATDMDGAALLSLSPESIAQVMKVTDVDPNVTQFVARSMLLQSVYLAEAHQGGLAAVRAAQARAIADEYGFDLPEDPSDFEAITEGLEEAAAEGGFFESSVAYEEQIGQLETIQGQLLGGAVVVPPVEEEIPYWMQGGSVLDEDDDAVHGFGAFIDEEEF